MSSILTKSEQLNYLKFRILNKIKYSQYPRMSRKDVILYSESIPGDCNKALLQLVDSNLLKKSKTGKEVFYSATRFRELKNIGINDQTFGVELEFASKIENIEFVKILDEMRIDVVKNDGTIDEYELREYTQWLVSMDGSINVKGYKYNVEIVSRILRGIQGLTEMKMIMDVLNTLRKFSLVKINKSCGGHVHHSSKSIRSMSKFIDIIVEAQPMMNRMVAKWRVITDEKIKWIMETRDEFTIHFAPATRDKYYENGKIDWYGDKYLNISIRNHLKNKTVEFRQHQATFNFRKLCDWIIMGQKLIEKAA